MTIDPKDLRRLIIRVILVTIAMRAVSLFSVDLSASEVSALLGLHAEGHASPLLSQLMAVWSEYAAGIRAVLRLPVLLSDVALVLLGLLFARVQGWGSISGLLAGLILAVAPFGLDEGWRADGTALLSVLSLGALLLLRWGLRAGRLGPVIASALILALGVFVSPLVGLIVLSGLYASARAVTGLGPRLAGLLGWILALAGGLGLRLLVFDQVGPGLGLAPAWLADPTLSGEGASVSTSSAWAFGEALVALSPGGPVGAVAAQLQMNAAPLWRTLIGLAFWPLALLGFVRGLVWDDSVEAGPLASTGGGAGAADGGRSPGVGVAVIPRTLGGRDLIPLLLGVLSVAAWVAWAAARGCPAGLIEALAVGRPLAALLLGVGLTAVAWRDDLSEPARGRKHFVSVMVVFTLVLFGLGGHHVYDATQRISRMAPRKVATFVASELSKTGALLCVGPSGMAVSWILTGGWPDKRLRRSSLLPEDALAQLEALLKSTPSELIVAGDRLPLEGALLALKKAQKRPGSGSLGEALQARLERAGYTLQEDGHRYLAQLAVRVYVPPERPTEGVRPQLSPGRAP